MIMVNVLTPNLCAGKDSDDDFVRRPVSRSPDDEEKLESKDGDEGQGGSQGMSVGDNPTITQQRQDRNHNGHLDMEMQIGTYRSTSMRLSDVSDRILVHSIHSMLTRKMRLHWNDVIKSMEDVQRARTHHQA
jgi:hypothetical protein